MFALRVLRKRMCNASRHDYTQPVRKQASIFICHSVLTHNNAKMYIKQADWLPEMPKAINAGCPKLTDNTM